jgi:hypothetical protein
MVAGQTTESGMTKNQKIVAWVLGLAAVGGVLYFATKAPAATATGTPGALPSGGTTRNVFLTQGMTNVTVHASLGDTISISLPTDGMWLTGGAAPIVMTYSGPTGSAITENWSIPTGGTQQTTIKFQTQ